MSMSAGANLPRYDAVVVGAGPAGSSAAVVLASAGMRVALVDKAHFPRDKLCGGLLSERCMGEIRASFGPKCAPPIEVTTYGASIFDRDRPVVRVGHYKPMHFTSRRTFDAHLVSVAAERGADILTGSAVIAVDFASGVVRFGDGRALHTAFIVGADGAGSRIRKLLGIPIDRDDFAVGLEAEVARGSVGREVANPEAYFGIAEWGYGWVFPKRDTLTVGIGGLAHRNADLRARYRELALAAFGRVPPEPLCGSPIPFGNFVGMPGRGSTLVVGDAAGLVEPLTGEGIAFAIQSGRYAAQAIVEAARIRAPERAVALYDTRYRSITRAFRDVRLLRHLVFSRVTRRAFLRALEGNERLVRSHMDVLAADSEYRDYARLVLAHTVRNLPRLARRAVTWAPSGSRRRA
jgi:geranylgeranyl reductase family protein